MLPLLLLRLLVLACVAAGCGVISRNEAIHDWLQGRGV
jgi:hypothetical protein